jgi:hypothetical protein
MAVTVKLPNRTPKKIGQKIGLCHHHELAIARKKKAV